MTNEQPVKTEVEVSRALMEDLIVGVKLTRAYLAKGETCPVTLESLLLISDCLEARVHNLLSGASK